MKHKKSKGMRLKIKLKERMIGLNLQIGVNFFKSKMILSQIICPKSHQKLLLAKIIKALRINLQDK